MSYLYHVDINSTQNAELMRYCKMENVPLEVLLHVDEPVDTLRLRLKSTVLRFLQSFNRKIDAMIGRISADVEHNRMVQRQL